MRKFNVKVRKPSRPPDIEPGLNAVLTLLRQVPLGFWAIVAVMLATVIWGTPHVLITYHCYGSCRTPQANVYACDYLGIQGWRSGLAPVAGRCAAVRFLPLDL